MGTSLKPGQYAPGRWSGKPARRPDRPIGNFGGPLDNLQFQPAPTAFKPPNLGAASTPAPESAVSTMAPWGAWDEDRNRWLGLRPAETYSFSGADSNPMRLLSPTFGGSLAPGRYYTPEDTGRPLYSPGNILLQELFSLKQTTFRQMDENEFFDRLGVDPYGPGGVPGWAESVLGAYAAAGDSPEDAIFRIMGIVRRSLSTGYGGTSGSIPAGGDDGSGGGMWGDGGAGLGINPEPTPEELTFTDGLSILPQYSGRPYGY